MSNAMGELIKLPWSDEAGPGTSSSGQRWDHEVTVSYTSFQAIRERVSEATPPNPELLRAAKQSRPPQSWWDDQADPFTLEETEG